MYIYPVYIAWHRLRGYLCEVKRAENAFFFEDNVLALMLTRQCVHFKIGFLTNLASIAEHS